MVSQRIRKSFDRLATGPDRRELTAALHSENTAVFPGLPDGPVKGTRSQDSAAVPQFGRFTGSPRIGWSKWPTRAIAQWVRTI